MAGRLRPDDDAPSQERRMKLRAVLTLVLVAFVMAVLSTFGSRLGASTRRVPARDQAAVAEELEALVRRSVDPTDPDAADRLLALYPDSGNLVSATGGRMVTSRDSVAGGLRAYWADAGRTMRNPRWVWDRFVFDVLAADAAVMTATYRVPHVDQSDQPREVGGAWTAAFVKREGRWMIVQEHRSDAAVVVAEPATTVDTTQLRGRRF
jgi:hypothetical protein